MCLLLYLQASSTWIGDAHADRAVAERELGRGHRLFPKHLFQLCLGGTGVFLKEWLLNRHSSLNHEMGRGMCMIFTVAIDGPAAAGKGTIARAVAKRFGFAHLDSGLLYRAVGVRTLEFGQGLVEAAAAISIARNLSPQDLERDDLRTAMAGQAASKVAALPEVRAALLEFQKVFARREGGAVVDGRDIGTVICPEAEVKLFVTASDEVRAMRRFEELVKVDPDTTFERVLTDLQARDARDGSRDTSPMVAADDALLLDTTKLSIDAAVAEAVALISKRIG